MTERYRESVHAAAWGILAWIGACASCALIFAFRDAVADQAPEWAWAWDAMLAVTLAIAIGLPLAFGRLLILIDDRALVVRFGLVRSFEKRIPLDRIESARPVSYRPIRQFGGWGIRRGVFEGEPTAVYSMKSRHGVLLSLSEPIDAVFLRTRQVLIGSLRGEELARLLGALR